MGHISAEVADRRSSCESGANIHAVPPLEVFTDPRKTVGHRTFRSVFL